MAENEKLNEDQNEEVEGQNSENDGGGTRPKLPDAVSYA